MRLGRRTPWIAFGVLVLLAIGERWVLPAWRAGQIAVGDAQWISAPIAVRADDYEWDPSEPEEGTGFFARRDFTVEEGFERVLLKVAGEEAFWVNLNDTAVAAGCFRPGGPLTVVDVTQFVRPGTNRLTAEVRAARPLGGLLLSLEIDGPRPQRIVSDEDWTVARDYRFELGAEGGGDGEDPEAAEALMAQAWGRPPTGRWGRPRGELLQPALADILLPGQIVPARRGRVGDPAGPWFRLPARPEQANPLGHWVTFDFGRPQNGYLSFSFRDKGPVRGLVYQGITPPDPRAERPTTVLLKLPGLATWTRAVPRRFRYVTLISPTRVTGAKVYSVEPLRARRLLEPEPPSTAALGMKMPLRTAVEDEIWRHVERLARGRVREDG